MAEGWIGRKVGRYTFEKIGWRVGWWEGRHGGGNSGRKLGIKVVGMKVGIWTKIDRQ